MGTALDSLASPVLLRQAWRDLYANASRDGRRSSGVDFESMEAFKPNSDKHLRDIARQIKHANYEFSALKPILITKPNGKKRLICVPTVRDRIVQKAILYILNDKDYGLANSVSFGFIKGRSVKRAAHVAETLRRKHPWAYKADITAFFDELDRGLLKHAIQKTIKTTSLHPLLFAALDCEMRGSDQALQRQIDKLGVKGGRGVRQGMPLSPLFANLILSDFDNVIIKHGISMVRYADDFIIFADNRKTCITLHSFCQQQLADINLRIHDLGTSTKTIIANPHECIDFLGLGLAPTTPPKRYHLIATEQQIKHMKERIQQYGSIDYNVKRGIRLSRLLNTLDGIGNGYKGVYDHCANSKAVDRAVDAAKKTVIKRVLKSLGINFSALTKAEKEFLQID